jgi:uncharacterized protein YndB with AHSA1/START domain
MNDDDSAKTAPGDCATVSVFVAVAPEVAFDVFTREIDLWWKQGPRYRIAGRRAGSLHFEPGPGARLFESFDVGSGPCTFEVGRVTVWQPPARLELEWRGVNFKPHEKTLVEVRFAPQRDGTLVTVKHSGWSALPPDHPARQGLLGPDFSRMIGLWWGDLMTSLRAHAGRQRDDA